MDLIDKDFIEIYTEAGKAFGLNDSILGIWAKLYLEPDPISMENLAKDIGYSLASVCNKVKMLETAGLVKRIRKPGTKKAFLYSDKNMMKMQYDSIRKRVRFISRILDERIPAITNKFKKKKLTDKEKKKLKILEEYASQLKDVKKMLEQHTSFLGKAMIINNN